MKPLRTTMVLLTAALLAAVPVLAEEGRTDGPEQSEYGKGGYPFGNRGGRLYLSPAFGSGIFNGEGAVSRSGLLYGVDLGYERDGWVGVQASYAYLEDRELSIYSVGTRLAYPTEPFVYYLSTHAGLYSAEGANRRFGLAPGAGVDVVVSDRIRLGLNYRHDFIFQDTFTQDVDRVYAGLKLYF